MLEVVADTLAAGLVIGGAYRLERVVGEGGMGVVWAAHEIRTGRAIALKFLREDDRDQKSRERFLREARAAMAIIHPNVARVEAVLETDVGVPFIVMELLEGESLRAMLRRRGPLAPQECARLLGKVVEAVAAAHARGIVHRDLKPENVFLVHGVDVRVLDFGIAKQLGHADSTQQASLTSTGALMGTPVYMAPEQLFGEADVDVRADVWALGVILYECLSGQRPTEGAGIGPIIKRITSGPLVPLEEARPGLPRSLTRIVGRMLLRHRADRPSLDEVSAVLAQLPREGEGDTPAPTQRIPNASTPTMTDVAPAGARVPPAGAPPPFPPPAFAPSQPNGEHLRIQSQMQLVSTLSLVASLVGLLLFFTPIAIVAVVLGLRARSLAKRAGGLTPVTATLGVVVGVLGSATFFVFVGWAALGIRDDQAKSAARVAALERELGDRASAPILEPGTACALAELYARKNGFQNNSGQSLRDFECGGRLSATEGAATLEDLRFAGIDKSYATTACLKRGTKWYVKELRTKGECPR